MADWAGQRTGCDVSETKWPSNVVQFGNFLFNGLIIVFRKRKYDTLAFVRGKIYPTYNAGTVSKCEAICTRESFLLWARARNLDNAPFLSE